MNLNKAIIVGRLTRDPEVRALPSGQSVASFGMATNRVWNNPNGEKQEFVEFHNIVTFGKLADICSRYLNKGRLVLIEGRIQTRSWQDQDGNKRYRIKYNKIIIALHQFRISLGCSISLQDLLPNISPI